MEVVHRYVDDTPTRFAELERTVEALREEACLASEREAQLIFQLHQKEEKLKLTQKHQLHSIDDIRYGYQTPSIIQPDNILRELNQQSDSVLGHIGQMVINERGQEQFLGAHTGIHFLSSASQLSRKSLGVNGIFPSWVFGLFFRQNQPMFKQASHVPGLVASLKPQLSLHHDEQVALFCREWGSLYPIVEPTGFRETLTHVLLSHRNGNPEFSDFELCTLFQLHAMEAINAITHDLDQESLEVCDSILASLFPRVCELEGRSQLALQTNGIIVRLAQSLGLHRYSQRFGHQSAEVERRKRLWWCIFICDINTSIHCGLPRLIRREDVDIDLSMNDDCHDHSIQLIPKIVPGEAASSLGLFRQQISLYQIISETLDQLYTTWNRRNGVSKIRNLENALGSWKRVFPFHSVTQPENDEHLATQLFAVARLKALAEFLRLLIHRPALTFEQSEPQFLTSMEACVESSNTLLSAILDSQHPSRLIQTWPLSLPVLLQLGIMLLYPFWTGHSSVIMNMNHLTLQKRIASLSDLLRRTPHDVGATTSGDIGDQTSNFLKDLCDKTIEAYQFRVQDTPSKRNDDASVLGRTHQADDSHCASWQSLMLSNGLPLEKSDLTQGSG